MEAHDKTAGRRFALLAAALAAITFYGSLHPFAFYDHGPAGAALDELLGSWLVPPSSRGDLIVNLVLYAPTAFFAALAMPERLGPARRILVPILAGLALSIAIELLQFYDRGRSTDMSDVYLNTAGAALGAIGAAVLGRDFHVKLIGGRQPFPLLLIVACLGWRLYPYVPTFEVEKFAASLRPLAAAEPDLAFNLFHQVVTWLVVAALLASLVGRQRSARLLALLYLVVMLLEIVILDQYVSRSELFGGAAAVLLWIAAFARVAALRRYALPALLVALVAVEAYYPFAFRPQARGFGWIPFLSLMHSSRERVLEVFCHKVFLYGALLWLLTRSGARLVTAALLSTALVFALRLGQVYVAGRSAEITDAVIVLILAAVMRLVAVAEADTKSAHG